MTWKKAIYCLCGVPEGTNKQNERCKILDKQNQTRSRLSKSHSKTKEKRKI